MHNEECSVQCTILCKKNHQKKVLRKNPGNKDFGKKVPIFLSPRTKIKSSVLDSCDFFFLK